MSKIDQTIVQDYPASCQVYDDDGKLVYIMYDVNRPDVQKQQDADMVNVYHTLPIGQPFLIHVGQNVYEQMSKRGFLVGCFEKPPHDGERYCC